MESSWMSVWVWRIKWLRFLWNGLYFEPSTCDSEYNKACKIGDYLDTKIFSCKKRLTDELVLECNSLIYTILLEIICLLLLIAICVSYYFYYI